MKRNCFMMAFVSLFTLAVFCSCSKDEDENDYNSTIPNNTITAVVENGASYNSKIDLVEAIVYPYPESDYGQAVLTNASYTDGGFTLILPASPGAQYLRVFNEIPENIRVNNPNVKIGGTRLEAYKSDSYAGYFSHETGNWRGSVIYVDGNLSISGAYTETETDNEGMENEETHTRTEKYNNCHLTKGWNMMYIKRTEKANNSYEEEYTTQTPAGMKWYFHDAGHSESASLRTQVPLLSAKQILRFLK
jgi:hypothetical protein